MSINKDYMLARLKEPSTWRGIILVLTAAGVPIDPMMADKVIAVGIALSGLVGIFTADPK